ncbi:hypothetical protein HDU86_007469 [Geranomyces michiganensis]|nr:hypothetical protein HDU86_007469 [Geranomyces michiganensis]
MAAASAESKFAGLPDSEEVLTRSLPIDPLPVDWVLNPMRGEVVASLSARYECKIGFRDKDRHIVLSRCADAPPNALDNCTKVFQTLLDAWKAQYGEALSVNIKKNLTDPPPATPAVGRTAINGIPQPPARVPGTASAPPPTQVPTHPKPTLLADGSLMIADFRRSTSKAEAAPAQAVPPPPGFPAKQPLSKPQVNIGPIKTSVQGTTAFTKPQVLVQPDAAADSAVPQRSQNEKKMESPVNAAPEKPTSTVDSGCQKPSNSTAVRATGTDSHERKFTVDKSLLTSMKDDVVYRIRRAETRGGAKCSMDENSGVVSIQGPTAAIVNDTLNALKAWHDLKIVQVKSKFKLPPKSEEESSKDAPICTSNAQIATAPAPASVAEAVSAVPATPNGTLASTEKSAVTLYNATAKNETIVTQPLPQLEKKTVNAIDDGEQVFDYKPVNASTEIIGAAPAAQANEGFTTVIRAVTPSASEDDAQLEVKLVNETAAVTSAEASGGPFGVIRPVTVSEMSNSGIDADAMKFSGAATASQPNAAAIILEETAAARTAALAGDEGAVMPAVATSALDSASHTDSVATEIIRPAPLHSVRSTPDIQRVVTKKNSLAHLANAKPFIPGAPYTAPDATKEPASASKVSLTHDRYSQTNTISEAESGSDSDAGVHELFITTPGYMNHAATCTDSPDKNNPTAMSVRVTSRTTNVSPPRRRLVVADPASRVLLIPAECRFLPEAIMANLFQGVYEVCARGGCGITALNSSNWLVTAYTEEALEAALDHLDEFVETWIRSRVSSNSTIEAASVSGEPAPAGMHGPQVAVTGYMQPTAFNQPFNQHHQQQQHQRHPAQNTFNAGGIRGGGIPGVGLHAWQQAYNAGHHQTY